MAEGCSKRKWLEQTGIETHPGPGSPAAMYRAVWNVWKLGLWGTWGGNSNEQNKTPPDKLLFKTINITSLNRQANQLLKIDGHIIFVQETAADKSVVGK